MIPGQGDVFDVAVIGGGIAGLTAAMVLARLGAKVVIASSQSVVKRDILEMIAPRAWPVLNKLALGESLAQASHVAARCHGVRSRWHSERAALEIFEYPPFDAGWIVSRPGFDRLLALRARECGATVMEDFKAANIHRYGTWRVYGASAGRPASIHAKFVIDATGRSALLARKLGAKLHVGSNQVAVIASFEAKCGAKPLPQYVEVEAVANGWWYAMPGNQNSMLLAFMTDGQRPDLRGLRSASGFHGALAKTLTMRKLADAHANVEGKAPHAVQDSRSACIDEVAGDGWLAAGDAATAYDPLTSQGLFNALASGYFAGHAALSHLRGNPRALPTYAALVRQTFLRTQRLIAHQYAMAYQRFRTGYWLQRGFLTDVSSAMTARHESWR